MPQNKYIYPEKSKFLLSFPVFLTIINIVKTVENKALIAAEGAIKWVK
jgi:hypothetical protein